MKTLRNWIKLLNDAFNVMNPIRNSEQVIDGIRRSTNRVTNENNLVVVVLGATAGGKSKLAIDVASQFNGEIISADSMQMYKGLDIITNKVTQEERNLVKHHLIDFVDPLKRLTVVDFRQRALNIIDDLLSQKKLPVIVGGTNYYIESLLWDVLVDPVDCSQENVLLFERDEIRRSVINTSHSNDPNDITKSNIFDHPIFPDSFRSIPSVHLYNILKEIDPDACNLYHPHDKRKIIRALQVIQSSDGSTLYSTKLKEQQKQKGGDSLGGPLRLKNSVILWTSCDKEILNNRIDERVDQMVKQGLFDELQEFHKIYNERRLLDNSKPVYSEGIFQAIGFKEFHEYLIKPKEKRKISLLNKCITRLKVSTKQYARKQIRWIDNRFISASDRDVPDIYSLDTSQPDLWDEVVKSPAFEIVSHRLGNLAVPESIEPVKRKERKIENVKKGFFCDICQRHFQGSHQFQIHLKSKVHANVKRKMQPVTEPNDKTMVEAVN